MSDFEQAIWKDGRRTFRRKVKMLGCYFYWGQAVWRKIVDLGLGPEYRKKNSEVRKICRRLLCLPFLPHGKIPRILSFLGRKATGEVVTLCQYIRNTGISPMSNWPPKTWPVYMQIVRTNNDAEGWRNRLNQKVAVNNPTFYRLCENLHKESRLLPLQVTLVCVDAQL